MVVANLVNAVLFLGENVTIDRNFKNNTHIWRNIGNLNNSENKTRQILMDRIFIDTAKISVLEIIGKCSH